MKITRKIILVLIMTVLMMCFTNCSVMANENNIDGVRVAGVGEIIDAGNGFIHKGNNEANKSGNQYDEEYFAEQFGDIGSVLVAVGVVVILGVVVVMGIKWITAKPDKKAQLQQQLVGVVVAAVVIFGAIGIWRFVKSTMQDVEESLAQNTEVVRNIEIC